MPMTTKLTLQRSTTTEGEAQRPPKLSKKQAVSTTKLEVARTKVKTLRRKLLEYEVEEERRREEHKEAFFKLAEFFEVLSARSCNMLWYGFQGALRQCVEAGLISRDADLDFLDL